MLVDKQGRYWGRRVSMAITRYRFISPVGDQQEHCYEQKYLLNVCLTDDDDIVNKPPKTCLEHCASEGDSHVDAISSLHSAASRGFSINFLCALAQLYVEHSSITEDEVDMFMSGIPVLGEHDIEPQGKVTDHLFTDPLSDTGT